MKLKVSYRRSNGEASEIVVTTEATATVAEVAQALIETDPRRPRQLPEPGRATLAVAPPGGRGVRLSPSRTIGESPIASGFEVSVVEAEGAAGAAATAAAAVVQIVAGPDAGKQFGIPVGSTVVGRDASADMVLNDGYVSKRHARIDVGNTIEVVDLNSANGLVVDETVVTRVTVLPGQEIGLGDTRIRISPLTTSAPQENRDIQGGAVPFHRAPRVEARYAAREFPRPIVPTEPEPPMFPWIMLIAPILMGTSMYFITGRAMSLLFVAMAPMMMAGNYVNTNKRNRRQLRTELDRYDAQLALLEQQLTELAPQEIEVRLAESPAVADVYQHALERGPLLWTRRPEHWSFLHLRLGTGTLPSRNTLAPPPDQDDGMPDQTQRLRDLEQRFRHVGGVPVVESAPLAGALGVVGTTSMPDTLRGLLVQLTGLHAPSELVVAALASPAEAEELAWLRWLPHSTSPHSPLEGSHLADSQAGIAQLVSSLEEIVEERLGRRADDAVPGHGPLASELRASAAGGEVGSVGGEPPQVPPLPVIVLVVTEHAPIDRARVVQLCERAAEAGILPIWVAGTQSLLPSVCRTFIDVSGDLGSGRVCFVRHGAVLEQVAVEGVSRDHAERFALALAPLIDSGAVVTDSSDLPQHVSMVSLLGDELAVSSHAVAERWRQNLAVHDRSGPPRPRRRAGTLRALVGQMGVDALHLDLRADGPHALVGGTTGSGKSEFLQAWVLGMAAEYSPDRVTFLFVDYKGGAAFAECVRLPHCVGLVTDLSPHLVRRALTSLRAELHHRERLLNRKRAKDLLELEKRGDPEAPPALVLVIDEFAALVGEVPEFVDGVVDIAQRGRSLGIHLIMATQRPAGVIRDNLRANTNLRIALRMADESDSSDVIGTPVAAGFDPALPGRAVAKTGPGRLTPFQSAYAGGHSGQQAPAVRVDVHELRFGAGAAWTRPEPEVEPEHDDPGPTDQVRLVESIIGASQVAEVPPPRRPWLDELSLCYDLALLGPRTDAELILGVADHPEKQAQELCHFRPDVDGNLAVYGTGGSGKSVVLRTLAVGAGVTPRGGPVHVYGLDFAAGGLRMLETLPHVGAIVSGDDNERVVRLIRTLREIAEQRARDYPAVNAGSIADYRRLADKPDEPRILLLIDNFTAFRESYEVVGPRAQTYAALQQLLGEGRQLGIHVVFTADRPASVPGSIAASVPRRVVLRLADDGAYLILGMPSDVLDITSPPGRAVVDDREVQISIFGGSGNVADQSQAIGRLARTMERKGVAVAPGIASLPTAVRLEELPASVDGLPVLGVSDETLGPIGFEPQGTFVLGGGPASGRTNAFVAMAQSLRRWKSDIVLVYFGSPRSAVPGLARWDVVATDPAQIADVAKQLAEAFRGTDRKRHTAVFVEGLPDLLSTPADAAVVDLIRAVKRSEHLVVGESDTSTWVSMYPIYSELRSGRRGLLLQPDFVEGDAILKTPFPRSQRSEFPVGRGMVALRGRAVRVQMPLADTEGD